MPLVTPRLQHLVRLGITVLIQLALISGLVPHTFTQLAQLLLVQ